jgi:hypothetical protein
VRDGLTSAEITAYTAMNMLVQRDALLVRYMGFKDVRIGANSVRERAAPELSAGIAPPA